MRRTRFVWILTVAVAVSLSFLATHGAQKVKAYNTQTSYTFSNVEQTPVHGLHVVLSAEGVVTQDEETGAAGPFRNVAGNGSQTIVLTNPESPIDAAGGENSSVDLVFKSYKSQLEVKTWWWIDEKGKRVGKKQKG